MNEGTESNRRSLLDWKYFCVLLDLFHERRSEIPLLSLSSRIMRDLLFTSFNSFLRLQAILQTFSYSLMSNCFAYFTILLFPTVSCFSLQTGERESRMKEPVIDVKQSKVSEWKTIVGKQFSIETRERTENNLIFIRAARESFALEDKIIESFVNTWEP